MSGFFLQKTLAAKGLQRLEFSARPVLAAVFILSGKVADAVNNARSLCKLAVFQDCEILPRDHQD
jgi:hypothetical protein